MERKEFLAKWKYLTDARAEIDREAARLAARYLRDVSPVQPGEHFHARGRTFVVTRLELQEPDIIVVYGHSVKARGNGRVEVFAGYTQPARVAANARPDKS